MPHSYYITLSTVAARVEVAIVVWYLERFGVIVRLADLDVPLEDFLDFGTTECSHLVLGYSTKRASRQDIQSKEIQAKKNEGKGQEMGATSAAEIKEGSDDDFGLVDGKTTEVMSFDGKSF